MYALIQGRKRAPMNINIKLKDNNLTIESDLPKKQTIEQMLIGMVLYYRDKQPEQLDEVMGVINSIYQTALEREPNKTRTTPYSV
jgi:hypothetical protein